MLRGVWLGYAALLGFIALPEAVQYSDEMMLTGLEHLTRVAVLSHSCEQKDVWQTGPSVFNFTYRVLQNSRLFAGIIGGQKSGMRFFHQRKTYYNDCGTVSGEVFMYQGPQNRKATLGGTNLKRKPTFVPKSYSNFTLTTHQWISCRPRHVWTVQRPRPGPKELKIQKDTIKDAG